MQNLSRTNIVYSENEKVVKKAGKIFRRKFYLFHPKSMIKKEIAALNELAIYDYFPNVIAEFKHGFEMEHCGETLTKKNLPQNWKEQVKDIIEILNRHKIIHRDIKENNFMVKKQTIKLIDFGMSMKTNERWSLCTRDLLNIPWQHIYDNEFAINYVFSQTAK